MPTELTTTVPPDREQSLRDKLGLGEGWTFDSKTDGFVKAKPCPIHEDLQKVYDEENRHTR